MAGLRRKDISEIAQMVREVGRGLCQADNCVSRPSPLTVSCGLHCTAMTRQEGLISLDLEENDGGFVSRWKMGDQPTVGASQLQTQLNSSNGAQMAALVAVNRQKSLYGGQARHRYSFWQKRAGDAGEASRAPATRKPSQKMPMAGSRQFVHGAVTEQAVVARPGTAAVGHRAGASGAAEADDDLARRRDASAQGRAQAGKAAAAQKKCAAASPVFRADGAAAGSRAIKSPSERAAMDPAVRMQWLAAAYAPASMVRGEARKCRCRVCMAWAAVSASPMALNLMHIQEAKLQRLKRNIRPPSAGWQS